MAVAGVVLADQTSYWVAAYTEAYTGTDLSSANIGKYEGYYCTVEAAKALFGGASTADGITTYLSDAANYATGYGAILEQASASQGSAAVGALTQKAVVKDQYEFKSVYGDPLVGSSCLAVLFYDKDETKGFRVMESDTTAIAQSGALFSDKAIASDGAVGVWTAATVPEPTSGLLLLLGVAGLALKRKRA